jgi:SPP1 gp7 family putative phage head morphogenesis protein
MDPLLAKIRHLRSLGPLPERKPKVHVRLQLQPDHIRLAYFQMLRPALASLKKLALAYPPRVDHDDAYDPSQPRDWHGRWTNGSGGKPRASTAKAWRGWAMPMKRWLNKPETGKLGEHLAHAYLKAMGVKGAKLLHANSAAINTAVDLIAADAMYEIKTGLASSGTARWRVTIGEPGKKEKEELKEMSAAEKREHNAKKVNSAMRRKRVVKSEYERKHGRKMEERTVALILDLDRQVADVHIFDGWHKDIGWNGKVAKASYKGSFHFMAPNAPYRDPPKKREDALPQSFQQALETWEAEWPNERLAALASTIGKRTSEFQLSQIRSQFKSGLGMDILGGGKFPLDSWIEDNVRLIRSVPVRYFDALAVDIEEAFAGGARWEDLALLIEERYGVAESDAARIASDQVGKLYGQLDSVRQQQAGVTRFKWRTMKDNRVRDSHHALEGEVFEWSEPPIDEDTEEPIIPGQAIRCRCLAEPVLTDLLED